MPKDEWGVKRLCPSCDNRFYDLNNDPMTCPNCGSAFSVADLIGNDGGARAAERLSEKAAAVNEADDDDLVLDDDTDVEIDDELLEDDDDDTVSLDDIADVSSGGDDD